LHGSYRTPSIGDLHGYFCTDVDGARLFEKRQLARLLLCLADLGLLRRPFCDGTDC
jgi:hypothetical protein